MTQWHYDINDTMTPWHHDTMTQWHNDTIIPWQHDIMPPWHYDTMTQWHHDTMTLWHYVWQHDIMTPWHHDTMMPWQHDMTTMKAEADIDVPSQLWCVWVPSLPGLSSGSSIICSGPSWTFSGEFWHPQPAQISVRPQLSVLQFSQLWAGTETLWWFWVSPSNLDLNYSYRQFK